MEVCLRFSFTNCLEYTSRRGVGRGKTSTTQRWSSNLQCMQRSSRRDVSFTSQESKRDSKAGRRGYWAPLIFGSIVLSSIFSCGTNPWTVSLFHFINNRGSFDPWCPLLFAQSILKALQDFFPSKNHRESRNLLRKSIFTTRFNLHFTELGVVSLASGDRCWDRSLSRTFGCLDVTLESFTLRCIGRGHRTLLRGSRQAHSTLGIIPLAGRDENWIISLPRTRGFLEEWPSVTIGCFGRVYTGHPTLPHDYQWPY